VRLQRSEGAAIASLRCIGPLSRLLQQNRISTTFHWSLLSFTKAVRERQLRIQNYDNCRHCQAFSCFQIACSLTRRSVRPPVFLLPFESGALSTKRAPSLRGFPEQIKSPPFPDFRLLLLFLLSLSLPSSSSSSFPSHPLSSPSLSLSSSLAACCELHLLLHIYLIPLHLHATHCSQFLPSFLRLPPLGDLCLGQGSFIGVNADSIDHFPCSLLLTSFYTLCKFVICTVVVESLRAVAHPLATTLQADADALSNPYSRSSFPAPIFA